MNSDLSTACRCFGVYDDEKIIAFMGVLHQPHGVNKNLKRVSRLVVLPDYQGIGIGYKFLNVVAAYYAKQGYNFSIVTSAKNFIMKLSKSEKWETRRLSINKCSSNKSEIDFRRESMRNKCKTASFMYKQN